MPLCSKSWRSSNWKSGNMLTYYRPSLTPGWDRIEEVSEYPCYITRQWSGEILWWFQLAVWFSNVSNVPQSLFKTFFCGMSQLVYICIQANGLPPVWDQKKCNQWVWGWEDTLWRGQTPFWLSNSALRSGWRRQTGETRLSTRLWSDQ